MKWFAVMHHGYLYKRHPSDDDRTLEEKGTEFEKLSTTDRTGEGLCAISDWLT